MTKSKRIPIVMAEEFVAEYDKFWDDAGFSTRSEAVRTACREQMLRHHLRRNTE